MKMNFKPALQYQFRSFFKGTVVIYLILVLVVAVSMFGTMYISTSATSTMSFTGYCVTAVIFLFVMGIVNIRNDLRLCIQYGVSRRTVFISELLSVMAASVILAVAGEALTGVAQILTANDHRFLVADLYQMIYLDTSNITLSLGQHVLSALVNTSLMFASCLMGIFFSLMFWRLNRTWSIIVGVSIPILLNGVPILLSRAGVNLEPLLNWISSSPFNFVLFCLFLAALFVIINWLLLRRANIKEAK